MRAKAPLTPKALALGAAIASHLTEEPPSPRQHGLAKAEKQRGAEAENPLTRQPQAEITRIERAIGKLIDASPVFQAKAALLKSIPGVGDVVALGEVSNSESFEPSTRIMAL